MKSIKRTVNAPVVILVAILCLVTAYHVGASRTIVVHRPAVIAAVDLPRVLEGLAQRSQAEATLETLHTNFRQERDRRERNILQIEHEMKELRERHRAGEIGPEPVQARADDIDLEVVNLRAWRQFMLDRFDVEQALLMQDIYRNIKKSIREMAESEGYDLVIFDTSSGELSLNPEARTTRTQQVEQQILARGVLYAGETLDITNDLIERMNNQFRANQAAR